MDKSSKVHRERVKDLVLDKMLLVNLELQVEEVKLKQRQTETTVFSDDKKIIDKEIGIVCGGNILRYKLLYTINSVIKFFTTIYIEELNIVLKLFC